MRDDDLGTAVCLDDPSIGADHRGHLGEDEVVARSRGADLPRIDLAVARSQDGVSALGTIPDRDVLGGVQGDDDATATTASFVGGIPLPSRSTTPEQSGHRSAAHSPSSARSSVTPRPPATRSVPAGIPSTCQRAVPAGTERYELIQEQGRTVVKET